MSCRVPLYNYHVKLKIYLERSYSPAKRPWSERLSCPDGSKNPLSICVDTAYACVCVTCVHACFFLNEGMAGTWGEEEERKERRGSVPKEETPSDNMPEPGPRLPQQPFQSPCPRCRASGLSLKPECQTLRVLVWRSTSQFCSLAFLPWQKERKRVEGENELGDSIQGLERHVEEKLRLRAGRCGERLSPR